MDVVWFTEQVLQPAPGIQAYGNCLTDFLWEKAQILCGKPGEEVMTFESWRAFYRGIKDAER